MNWSERYNSNNLENSDQQQPAAQNSIGHHLNQLYMTKMILYTIR